MSGKIRIFTLLRPFGFIYGIITAIRNLMYNCGVLKSHTYRVPVISIGNITVGGTGKTPHTEYITNLLSGNSNIAVLSRGYGRNSKGFKIFDNESTAQDIGDEPFQIASKFPNTTVAVCENRAKGIDLLLKNKNYDAIILDDAYQHRRVRPSLNILLTDYNRNILDDCMLPAGRLREWAYNRKRANIIVVTKCPANITDREMDYLTERLATNGQQLYFSRLKYGNIYNMENPKTILHTDQLQNSAILLLSGIASPEQMANYLKQFTDNITSICFNDHHNYSIKDINEIEEKFLKISHHKRYIITTEKDAARLKSIIMDNNIRSALYILPIEIEFIKYGNKFDQNIIDHIQSYSQ